MNIFATSADPAACAEALDDRRINKMIVESCQILSTVLYASGRSDPQLYKPAYVHHPVVIWTASDPRNYAWLFRHLVSLFEERVFRTGKFEHRSRRLLPALERHVETDAMPRAFENCTPYKALSDTHLAYRLTLAQKWHHDIHPPTWIRRGRPAFFGEIGDADQKR